MEYHETTALIDLVLNPLTNSINNNRPLSLEYALTPTDKNDSLIFWTQQKSVEEHLN